MKKFFFIALFSCFSIIANAQAYLGGTIGIAVESSDSETSSAFFISPEGGYSFNKIWAVGASVAVQYQDVYGMDLTTVSVLPYVRATFARAGIVDFFGELSMGYMFTSFDGEKANGFEAGLRPGLKINFSDRFALLGRTTLLRYSYCEEVDNVGFSINGNLELGVQFTF